MSEPKADPWGWVPGTDGPVTPTPTAPAEAGEGGTDELVAPGEAGPRDGDIGQYEDEE